MYSKTAYLQISDLSVRQPESPKKFPRLFVQDVSEIYFNPLTRDNIEKIIYGAAERIKINIEQNAVE